MSFLELSTHSEKLLEEILHQKYISLNDHTYWKERFQELTCEEDVIYRESFKELLSKGYIDIPFWADDSPYYIEVLNSGMTYFESKKKFYKNQKLLNRREWIIAIVSAVLGGLIAQLPNLITAFGNL